MANKNEHLNNIEKKKIKLKQLADIVVEKLKKLKEVNQKFIYNKD